jgi:HTH-type transcriptional regulator, transcriptional repressor of NAD biosynthesis genes
MAISSGQNPRSLRLQKVFKTGLVVGKFAPLHKGHEFVLKTALAQCEQVIVLVYSNPDFSWMPAQTRASWVQQLFPQARVYIPENPPPNEASDFTQREFVKFWLEQNHFTADAVFGSDDYLQGFAAHIGAMPIKVDATRDTHPISGTVLRQAVQHNQIARFKPFVSSLVFSHLEFWAQPIKKVVFLGAESTGKSSLTARMAQEYNTRFVAEFGREVWEAKNGQLALEDYVFIAKRHLELEDAALLESQDYLFVDTNAITTMFLGYAYEGRGLPELTALARIAESRYHFVFLCNDDIPFAQDGWRDDAVWRSRAQGMVRYDLAVRGIAYTEVSGDLDARVAQVKAILE